MLERIREGAQGPWAMAIIGLIVLSFVFAGVGSYLTSSTPTAVASVNGEEITANELERAYQNQRAQMESQFGEGISALFADPAYLAQFRSQVLEQLVSDLLLKQHAESIGLRVSDQQVKEAIVNLPQFQVGGQFDNDRYLFAIRQAGFQVADFREYLRREMTRDQLSRALGASGFGLGKAATDLAQLEQQTRSAKTLTVGASLFAADIQVSEEEQQVYYDANITRFDTEEQANVAYIELNVADLESEVSIDDADVSAYYEENIAAYQTEETRNVSHILVEFGDDRDAAKARIDALQQRIASGEDFAQVAQSDSDDTFSAEQGGDLGEISKDMMGDEFEAAAFALAAVGDVSDVVETEFGFHLIKATSIVPSSTTPFSDVQADILATLRRDSALDRFYELQGLMAQLAFEVPDSLEDLAAELNTEVKTTGLFARSSAPAPFERADILAQVFSDELISDQVNSDVIELDGERVMVMRIAGHEPQRTRPLTEVKEQIVATLRAEKAQDAATTWAEELVQLQSTDADTANALLADKALNWETKENVARSTTDMARAMSEALFALSEGEGENTQVVELGNGDVGIVQLLSVNAATEVSSDTVTQYQQRLAATSSRSMLASLVEDLRSQSDVQIMQVVTQ